MTIDRIDNDGDYEPDNCRWTSKMENARKPRSPRKQYELKQPSLEPAASIIRKLGGNTRVAAITGVHYTRVSNWKRPREGGGTGGIIPHWHIDQLIADAQSRGIELTPADFAPVPRKVKARSDNILRTSSEVVAALGGYRQVAEIFDVSGSTAANWIRRGFPAKRYLQLIEEAEARGLKLAPSLVGMTVRRGGLTTRLKAWKRAIG